MVIRYSIGNGNSPALFEGMTKTDEKEKLSFFRTLRERIPALYQATLTAVDPNDAMNTHPAAPALLRAVCANNFISAQRGLDDVSQKERVVIGRVLENLFSTAKANAEDADGHTTAELLEAAVKEIQDESAIISMQSWTSCCRHYRFLAIQG